MVKTRKRQHLLSVSHEISAVQVKLVRTAGRYENIVETLKILHSSLVFSAANADHAFYEEEFPRGEMLEAVTKIAHACNAILCFTSR